MTYQQIAKVFNKNHATVLHALKEWPYMVKYNSQLDAKKDQVVDYINENCTQDGRRILRSKLRGKYFVNSKIKEQN